MLKPTDKGGGLVLMDNLYRLVNKVHLYSNVYKEVSLDSEKKAYK